MKLDVGVYQMDRGVIVDSHFTNQNVPLPIDSVLKQEITPSAKKVKSRSYSVDEDRLMSPQGIFTLYIHRLNEHFGPQIRWEDKKINEDGLVLAHVTEYGSFCSKHIGHLHTTENRLM